MKRYKAELYPDSEMVPDDKGEYILVDELLQNLKNMKDSIKTDYEDHIMINQQQQKKYMIQSIIDKLIGDTK